MPRSHYGKFGRCNAPVPAFAPCACRQRSIDPRLRWIAASTDALGGARWDDYPMRPTVLIVDDHAEFRRSAGALLEAEGFGVIAEGADGDEAIAAVERVRPQIVLLDVQLPGVDGFAVAQQLAAGRAPPPGVPVSSPGAAAYC